MRKTVILAILLWCSPGQSQIAEEGNYIVVRGALIDCEGSRDRVLDVVLVDESGFVSLVGIPNLAVINLDGNSIESKLLDVIESKTGNRPRSVNVEVLTTIEKSIAELKERGRYLAGCNPPRRQFDRPDINSAPVPAGDFDVPRAKLYERLV